MERRGEEEKKEEEDERSDADEEEENEGLDDDRDGEADGDEDDDRDGGEADGDEDDDCDNGEADGDEDDDRDDGEADGDEDDDEEAPGSKRARLQTEAAREKKSVAPSDRKCIPGIVYLGHIPPKLTPIHVRNLLSPYGEIGRIFLQPGNRVLKRRNKKAGSKKAGFKGCSFTEGWVEFRDKRIAKRVAATLHNTSMGAKKRSRIHADLWCIKYLHRFHWTHLSERLAYERTVLQQRLRTEISQAKRETNFYLSNVEKSHNLDQLRKKREKKGEKVEGKQWEFTQRLTEEEIKQKKMKNSISQKHLAKAQDKARLMQEMSQSNVSLLAKIFNASKSQD